MTDPRRPRGKESLLPDALDQAPAETAPSVAEEHGSEDAQLLAAAGEADADVERETPARTSD